MKTINSFTTSFLFLLIAGLSFTQAQTVDLYEAVNIALQRNYDVRIAGYSYEIDQNNAEAGNAGYYPYIYVDGFGSYSSQNTEISFANPEQPGIEADNASTINYGASANLEYLIFNGGKRMHFYRQLETLSEDGRLRQKLSMETTSLQVSGNFLEVLRLNDLVAINKQSAELSLDRLTRARENYEYGNITRLQLLNAEVDLRTDSINLVNSELELTNGLRRLNLSMGIPADTSLTLNTDFGFIELIDRQALLDQSLMQNTIYLRARNNQLTADESLRSAKGDLWPTLSANAAYQYNYSDFEANFLSTQENLGWNAGLALRINVFDGSRVRRNIRNAELQTEIASVQEEQSRNELIQLVNNAYDTYLTNIELLKISRRNLDLAQANYDRSVESFGTGQITGVELRTAQVNLNDALNAISRQRLLTKVAEIALLFEAGMLLQ